MELIKCINVSKTFGEKVALDKVSIDIPKGKIFGLLGPNGAGKTTLIRIINRITIPSSGTVLFDGRPITQSDVEKIGYLPEESYLYKYLTAEETLDFFGALFNLSAAERKNRIDQLLDMVGLAHARHRRVGEFSKGMQRRIGLAQAMINDPELLILDEPTSGLDPLGCREIKDLILALKKRGKTVIITSHLLSDIEDVCDRVIVLYGGKVRAEGSLTDLLTVSGENRITTPALEPAVLEQVLKLLRENLNGETFKVDHPRRTLEEFFLDVVARAKSESAETAGAASGGRIADYLSAPADETSAVLEQLVQELPAQPRQAAAPVEEAAVVQDEAVSAKLDSLTGEVEVKAKEEPAPAAAQEDAAKLDEVNQKLNDILGNRK